MDHFESFNRKRGFDATAITDTIKRALASAGLDTSAGPLVHVTGTIEQALSAAGLMPGKAPVSPGTTFDGTARVVDPEDVTPELARATIESVEVLGAFHASARVRDALRDRIR